MRFTCFSCGRQYDYKKTDDKWFACECGKQIDLEELRSFEHIIAEVQDHAQFGEIQKMADDICFKIVNGEFSKVDMDIATEELRGKCNEYFPEKMYLFTMLYESRFKRLWQQFRSEENT